MTDNESEEIDTDVHKAMENAIAAFNKVMHEWDVAFGIRLEVKQFYSGEVGVMRRYIIEDRWEDTRVKDVATEP